MTKRSCSAIWLILIAVLCGFSYQPKSAQAALQEPPCEKPGWFPEDFGLKDHTVFWYNGYYYIAANYLPGEKKFAYGRSTDMCEWEMLEPILAQRTPGTWDEKAVWSPYVFLEAGVYYLYFTGVTQEFTQSILLETSTDPADPAAWEMREMVFQPDHAGSTWQETGWADCRDPMLIKIEGTYYLYYSAYDEQGGIIGVATSDRLTGGWMDWGSVIPYVLDTVPESSSIFTHDSFFYLFYHLPSQPESYRIGASPSGPWLEPAVIGPGWAHEFWVGMDSSTYTSYLTDYSISISPLTWKPNTDPPQPFIGAIYYRTMIPLISR